MIHHAGRIIGGVQLCVRCGALLSDYRNAQVPTGTPPLSGFATGAFVEVIGANPRTLFTTDDKPTCRIIRPQETPLA